MRRLRPPGLSSLFTLVYVAAGWWLGLRPLSDNSFLWHLRTGHLILDRGIPRRDPYSFTAAGTKWVAQSWLAELAYGLLDDLGGGLAVRLFGAALGAVFMLLLYRLALRLCVDRVRAALVVFAALCSLATVWSERPLMIGLVLMLVTVWVVEMPESPAGRNALLVVPATFWLWANVHGSFSLGIGYLGLHLAGRWLDGAPPWKDRERRLALAGGAGFLACLANPYGFDLLWFPVRLLARGDVLADVVEWMSPDFREPGRGMFFGLWLALLVAAMALTSHRASRRDVALAVPFVLLSLWAVRNVGVTTLVTLPLVARAVATEQPRADTRSPLGWVSAAAVALLLGASTAGAASGKDLDLSTYPVAALGEMRGDELLGRRLFTTDGWAGYLIAFHWPEQKVYMDDRYDMYPSDVMDDYQRLAGVRRGWKDVLEDRRIEVVLWPEERSLAQALDELPGWERVYRDEEAVVFVRDGRAP